MSSVYVIGSLRDRRVPDVAMALRAAGFDAFDGWYSAGPEADDYWREHERLKGSDYRAALGGHAARNVYSFDRFHLHRCHMAVLVLPAGRSCHIEAGVTSANKPVHALLPEGDDIGRWDVMTQFLGGVHTSVDGLIDALEAADPRLPTLNISLADASWLAGVLAATPNDSIGLCDIDPLLSDESRRSVTEIIGDTPLPEVFRVLWPYLDADTRKPLVPQFIEWLSDKEARTRSWYARALHLEIGEDV